MEPEGTRPLTIAAAAVKVTFWPIAAGFGVANRTMSACCFEIGEAVTMTVDELEVADVKLESPA